MFKQHYTYFHTFFHPHVFQKNTNNITQTPLSNEPWNFLNQVENTRENYSARSFRKQVAIGAGAFLNGEWYLYLRK